MGASSPRPFGRVFGVIVALVGLWTGVAAAAFTTFESGQVRPLAMSPDGTRLFAVNTPDDRLEIFSLTGGTPVHTGSVPVGLEPVAVAARSNSEVWVVNHLSDSISIIDVSTSPARVTRTLLVCDEPRDLVFAGPGGNRAFVTTARRGQNCSVAPNLTTARRGRRRSRVTRLSRQRCSIGSTRCRRRVEASLDRSRRAAEALAPCLALPPLPSQPERTHELARMQARPSSGQGPPTVPPHPLAAVSSRALSGLGADLGRAATVRPVWLLSDPTPHEVVSRAQH